MGQFSWLYSDTKQQLVINKDADAYLLVPPLFQDTYGKAIYESCYDGYGHFGGYDIYELIAQWNKEYIPKIIKKIKRGEWKGVVDEGDLQNLQDFYEDAEIDCELRLLGIIMSCFDEDNCFLQYPIKITTKIMDYDDVEPSKHVLMQ